MKSYRVIHIRSSQADLQLSTPPTGNYGQANLGNALAEENFHVQVSNDCTISQDKWLTLRKFRTREAAIACAKNLTELENPEVIWPEPEHKITWPLSQEQILAGTYMDQYKLGTEPHPDYSIPEEKK